MIGDGVGARFPTLDAVAGLAGAAVVVACQLLTVLVSMAVAATLVAGAQIDPGAAQRARRSVRRVLEVALPALDT